MKRQVIFCHQEKKNPTLKIQERSSNAVFLEKRLPEPECVEWQKISVVWDVTGVCVYECVHKKAHYSVILSHIKSGTAKNWGN